VSASFNVASAVEDRWIVRRSTNARAPIRLFCFPHAGGGSLAYFPWTAALAPEIEVCAVQLPGRENRLREPPIDDLARLRERLVEALLPALHEGPFAVFGHSFGALVAFELVRELRRLGAPLPRLLIAAGRAAPSRGQASRPLHAIADDEEFIDELERRYGGIPAAIRGERALLDLLLPTLRADLKLTECYEYRAESPLPVPIWALGGRDDPGVDAGALRAWSLETDAGFAAQTFAGGHFFVQDARADVLGAIRSRIGGC
jgi:medium-chain acyl-[acyl-carrier-protein] hydrolase